jgi:Tol biopolymer transport system component/tRNA A-37 threonylcarbamoyl transferase component Bud32
LVGVGGMGEVYRARDTSLNRDVAIKVLPESLADDPERLARFDREAQLLAALNHPNIAAVHGLEHAGAVRALVMEFVDGPTLEETLLGVGRSAVGSGEALSHTGSAGMKPVPVDEAVLIARQIADALEAAHERGIIHRDLKPANIKVTADGQVKVLDFGLAKALDPGSSSTPNAVTMANSPTLTAQGTAAGVILGTAAYMSPEQARGKSVDKRSDIWAFGVVLYEILAGRRLFTGETVSDVIAAVLTREIDWTALPATTPAPVRRLLERCLERDPKKRLRDIGDARHELDAKPAEAEVPSQPAPAAWRRTAALMAATAVAAAALTFGVTSLGTLSGEATSTLTFPIPAPPDTRLFQATISPDGRTLVVVAESSDGVSHLWIRELDARDVRRIEGTDGARDPFWSPDSRSIGYFTEARLWKVDVETGVTEALAVTANTRGGAWNEAGTIIVGGEDLLAVPANGGDVSTVLPIDAESGENAIRYPWFLPDGNHVLYYSRNAKDRTRAGLYVAALEGGVRKQLTATASSSAVFVPSGHLLYRRDRYLVAHPFDVDTLEFTGDPRPIADDLWYEPSVTALTGIGASRSGTVVFKAGGEERTELVWFDRSGERTGTVWEPKGYVGMGLSNDGTKLLAGFPGDSAERNVWLYDIPTGTARQVTSTGDAAGNVVFSDDGTQGLLGVIQGPAMTMLRARFGSGTTPEPVPTKSQNRHATDWKGNHVVYETSSDSASSLQLLDLETGSEQALVETPAHEMFGTISPDGRWLAYESNENGQWNVYVQTFPELTGRWPITTDGGHQPRWNPRGGELFYLAPDRRLVSVLVRAAGTEFRWDTPRTLFKTDIVDLGPYRGAWGYAVGPDGNRFLITTRRPQGSSPAVAIVNWK